MDILYKVQAGSWGDEYVFSDGKKALDLAQRLREGSTYDRTVKITLEEMNPTIKEEEE